MLVLAIDTTSDGGGGAVFRDEELLAAVLNDTPINQYAVTIFEMVNRGLAQAGAKLADIELYAVANGPGSFTGIRVGLAAVQGWATAFGKPARGVSVLEAMVEQARPRTEWAVPILDARREEFYYGEFRRLSSAAGQASFAQQGEGKVLRIPQLVDSINESARSNASGGKITCIARSADLKAQALRETLAGSCEWLEVEGPVLSSIARLALRAQGGGHATKPADLDACYIRRTDAEINLNKAGS